MQNRILKNIEVLFAFDSKCILKHETSVKFAEVIVSLSYLQFLLFTDISSDTFRSQKQAVLFANNFDCPLNTVMTDIQF